MSNYIGIDVSKSTLNIHISKNSLDLQINNTLKDIKKLYSKLKKIYKKEITEIIFIFEPTGSYSEALRKFCFEKEIKCFIINPKQFANYAKALGENVKSDKTDARVLSKAISLAKEGQVKVPYYNKDVERIKELMSFYKFTCKQTSQLRNHLESLETKDGDSFAIKELKKSLKASKDKEELIIKQVLKVIDSNDEYKKSYKNIKSITGVGPIAAIALLHLFIKYPEANQRQIVSLVGLNPVYKQSGSSLQTLPKISKAGSALYRGSLFMGVMSAIRYDDRFKSLYDRLKANGKHTTQAQIAVMRKIIIIAHSLYKNKQEYVKDLNKDRTDKEVKTMQ